ncbi:MAG: biliverdin-producing heme oxygenase [Gammaproteobacteria bacterium]|nr:MAG: biliverdin-producing heme oxygenase [Gammaproteobacteria bacterium]
MNFFEQLATETQPEQQLLMATPILQRAVTGDISLIEYVNFLTEAYHHVKHTTPLLMAAGSRMPGNKEWLRNALAEYIEEELGHQEWILNDIEACGFDKEEVRHSQPSAAAELMVSYAYDIINRVNPMGFFGMVHVLEGTSISIADNAAVQIAKHLSLPKECFSYLTSHGALDIKHVAFFKELMNKVDEQNDQRQIIHCAKIFYKLYGDVFNSISRDR